MLIAALAFVVGQGREGAGVPVVIALSLTWVAYAQRRWGTQRA